MLKEKDKIFSNLYGIKERGIDSVISRGHWDNTAKFIKKGSSWMIVVKFLIAVLFAFFGVFLKFYQD